MQIVKSCPGISILYFIATIDKTVTRIHPLAPRYVVAESGKKTGVSTQAEVTHT